MRVFGEKEKIIALAMATLFICVFIVVALSPMAIETASLRPGSTGDKVKEIQQNLKDWGYYDGNVDGIFGHKPCMRYSIFRRSMDCRLMALWVQKQLQN